ncbi:MAG: DUF4097 family beta strand repeat-containing protein [Acidobacteriota bacterium]
MNDPRHTPLDTLRFALIGLATIALLVSPAHRAAAAPPGEHARPAVSEGDDDGLRQTLTDHETKVLTLGANGSLEVKNVSGDVTVTAGSGRDVRVEITRRARGRTDDDARLGLQRVTVAVDQQGNRGVVATQYPNDERRNSYSVDVIFNITAPTGTRVSATSVSGDVKVENIKADVSMNVVSGNVTLVGAGNVVDARTISGNVTVTDMTGESLTLTTVSGDVTIDRATARRIEAETTSGDVRASAVNAERATLRSLSGDVGYAGTISKAGRYELQSHSGDVAFTPAGAVGYDLQATTFSGTITPPRGMATAVMSTSRARAFHGTVGSGGASVTITTFSGDVRIGR